MRGSRASLARPLLPSRPQAGPHCTHTSVHSNEHQSNSFRDKHGSFSSAPHGDVINSTTTEENQPALICTTWRLLPVVQWKLGVLKSLMYIHTISLTVFKTKIKVHLFKSCCINKNEIEKEPNDHLKFKIPKSSNLYHCGRLHQGFWEVQGCFS